MALNVGFKKVILEWEPIHDKGSHLDQLYTNLEV